MAIFDRMRERMRGQRPIGAAGGIPGQMAPQMTETGMTDADLNTMARGRTAEEAEAYRMGEQMGAESLMQMAGITPIRKSEIDEENRIMNLERLNKATQTLINYRAGKASVNRRVISAQQWWKLKNWEQIKEKRGTEGSQDKPSNTGWLWNCIVGKHADAIDSYPEPIILPRMEDDKQEATNLSKIVPVVMELNDFEETYNDAMWQKMQEGTGVYGIFWDNSKLNGLGDIAIRKVNILNLYWEPGISDIQESRNVFYLSFEDKEDLIARYPELDGKLNTTKLAVDKYKTDDNIDVSNKVAVVDWYYKKFEGGRTALHYCKYVNESVLYSSEEAGLAEGYYADGKYPFVLDPLYPVEGSPAGYGYIDIASDTQSDIDTLSQAMVQNAAMGATPRALQRTDGSINEEEFSDWRRKIVHVNGPIDETVIRWIEAPPMGAYAQNMLQQKIDEIKFVTGNTDVNNGGVPAGVTAASAIAALKEDSGRSSKDSTKAAYRAYKLIVTMVIERIRQFYDIPRSFRILGQDGQEEFVNYSNERLKLQMNPTLMGMESAMRLPVFDIEVRAQRENAYTKMSQNELAIQFWQMGALNPQMADQALLLLDMMDFRGKEELRKKLQQQQTMAQVLSQVGQIALQLASRYAPALAEQLATILQGVAVNMGAAPVQGAEAAPKLGAAPDDATDAPQDPQENGIVRRAREQAEQATRPS